MRYVGHTMVKDSVRFSHLIHLQVWNISKVSFWWDEFQILWQAFTCPVQDWVSNAQRYLQIPLPALNIRVIILLFPFHLRYLFHVAQEIVISKHPCFLGWRKKNLMVSAHRTPILQLLSSLSSLNHEPQGNWRPRTNYCFAYSCCKLLVFFFFSPTKINFKSEDRF